MRHEKERDRIQRGGAGKSMAGRATEGDELGGEKYTGSA